MAVSLWPTLNAGLNAASAVLLTLGYITIRKKRMGLHILCMLGATLVSLIFLISYVAYHAQVGSVRFQGEGWMRNVYFAILISHTILAVTIIPLVLMTLSSAAKRNYARHTKMGHGTLPLWLYVSVTGVTVYWMLYHAK